MFSISSFRGACDLSENKCDLVGKIKHTHKIHKRQKDDKMVDKRTEYFSHYNHRNIGSSAEQISTNEKQRQPKPPSPSQ